METAPRHLLDGTADVAFLRLCFLEEWLERHPEHQGRFKVINRKDGPGEVCARSTELYPTWTVGTTKVTDPRVSRSVTQALLALKPTGANGIYWGVATDYSSVDKLFRETRTGPYAYLNTWSLKRFIAEYWHWLTPTELARVQQGVLVRIVDDDDSLRDALRFVLETEGWRVVDYRSANDFFRGDAPSVRGCVVMDVRMPGLTGIEAQAVMNERGFSLPVIFLTGHGDIDMAVMALHEGAADFIQKPVDNERLLAVIASTAFESLSGAGAVLDGETAKARCAELTNRERDIARLVAEGLTNRLIGERLSIAVRTVEVHRASALRKLGVRTPEEVRAVLEAGA